MLARLSQTRQEIKPSDVQLEVKKLIEEMVTAGFCLSTIRREVISLSRSYPGFVIWAPSVDEGVLVSLIWYWEHGEKVESESRVPMPSSRNVTGEGW